MRGSDERSGALFSYVDLESRVPIGSFPAGDLVDRERDAGRRAGSNPAARLQRVRWSFTLAAAVYNLIRLPKLIRAMA
jgi:hypothetical protein